jgi:transposase InsO family protein
MQELQLHGLPKRRTTRRNLIAVRTVSDLVNRDFTATGPNQLWVTDITEHPTREGRVFCCVVLDAYSRKAVGWSIDRIADAALVNSALNMAATSRPTTRETIIHADHGAQFTSWAFTSNVRNCGLKLSLVTIGDCYECQSVLVGLLVDSEDLTSAA